VSRFAALQAQVQMVEDQGLRRELRAIQMNGPTTGRLNDASVVVFCSNDYLGLAHHPDVVAAFKGSGAGASRLISGNRPVHEHLEERLGLLYGRPATVFSSGYHANLALMSTVVDAGDSVASDALNHASIIDGLRLSKAKRHILPHGEPEFIEPNTRMVVVEGLYSMDGDVLKLERYSGEHWLAVDEAHAVGAMGPGGRGVAAAQGVEPDFLVGTLGKALGTYGAFVVGPPSLRELLISRGRSFIFTTGLPEPVVCAATVALALANDERRDRLSMNVQRFRNGLSDLGISALGSNHIVPVVFGDQTMAVADALLARGFWAAGIRAPTVPAGTERVRFTLSSAHTHEQIDQLLDALDAVVQEVRNADT
jgi:7-keto-8-aminopelargonate synthetase-like enzyme